MTNVFDGNARVDTRDSVSSEYHLTDRDLTLPYLADARTAVRPVAVIRRLAVQTVRELSQPYATQSIRVRWGSPAAAGGSPANVWLAGMESSRTWASSVRLRIQNDLGPQQTLRIVVDCRAVEAVSDHEDDDDDDDKNNNTKIPSVTPAVPLVSRIFADATMSGDVMDVPFGSDIELVYTAAPTYRWTLVSAGVDPIPSTIDAVPGKAHISDAANILETMRAFLDQPLKKDSDVSFGSVNGRRLDQDGTKLDDLDARVDQSLTKESTVEFGGVIAGTLTVVGTVNGRDLAADAEAMTNLATEVGVIQGELSAVETRFGTHIDQPLLKTSDAKFGSMTMPEGALTAATVNGVDLVAEVATPLATLGEKYFPTTTPGTITTSMTFEKDLTSDGATNLGTALKPFKGVNLGTATDSSGPRIHMGTGGYSDERADLKLASSVGGSAGLHFARGSIDPEDVNWSIESELTPERPTEHTLHIKIGPKITGGASRTILEFARENSTNPSIMPGEDATIDLGTSTRRWRALYMQGDIIMSPGAKINDRDFEADYKLLESVVLTLAAYASLAAPQTFTGQNTFAATVTITGAQSDLHVIGAGDAADAAVGGCVTLTNRQVASGMATVFLGAGSEGDGAGKSAIFWGEYVPETPEIPAVEADPEADPPVEAKEAVPSIPANYRYDWYMGVVGDGGAGDMSIGRANNLTQDGNRPILIFAKDGLSVTPGDAEGAISLGSDTAPFKELHLDGEDAIHVGGRPLVDPTKSVVVTLFGPWGQTEGKDVTRDVTATISRVGPQVFMTWPRIDTAPGWVESSPLYFTIVDERCRPETTDTLATPVVVDIGNMGADAVMFLDASGQGSFTPLAGETFTTPVIISAFTSVFNAVSGGE